MIIVHFFLLTNSGDPDGIWNDLRPFRLNLSTGNIILGSDILTVINGGNIGIGTLTPGAKLTVGENLGGTAASTTFKTNAGSLGSISGSTIKLASIGFQSSNSSSLGIEARRTSDGEDWQTTAIGLKHDVDNNSPVRNSEIWLTASGKIGVGTVNLYGRFSIQPLGTLDDNTPLFEVKNKLGVPVLAVYNNGVRILVEDTDGKGVKGGFAIGGFDPTKAGEETVNLMMVSADSIRLNIDNNPAKAVKGGFAIGSFDNLKSVKSREFMQITPQSSPSGQYNAFIGHSAGTNNKTGMFNVFIGDQSGKSGTDVSYRTFLGSVAGCGTTSDYNTFFGSWSGLSNITGEGNIYVRTYSGFFNTGSNNTLIGYSSRADLTGSGNVFIGYGAGEEAGTTNNKLIIDKSG